MLGTINAIVGWVPFALAKMRIRSQNQKFLFIYLFILTFALEMRICKIYSA